MLNGWTLGHCCGQIRSRFEVSRTHVRKSIVTNADSPQADNSSNGKISTASSAADQVSDGQKPDQARKTTLLIVFVVVFIDLLGFGIVLPLLPRYGAHFDASRMQLGLLMAAFSAMQFLFAPIWGALSDRIGRRPVLIVGLVGSTLAYLMFGVATGLGRDGVLLGIGALPWLFITRIAAGIAGATISTAQAVIADSTGAMGRGKGMALIGAAFGIGFTFGPLIGAACTSATPTFALNDAQYTAAQEWNPESETVSAEQTLAMLNDHGEVATADKESLETFVAGELPLTEVKEALTSTPSAAPGYVAAVLSFLALILAVAKLPESRPVKKEDVTSAKKPGLLSLGASFQHMKNGNFTVLFIAIFLTTFAFAQFESTLSLLTREFGYSSQRNFLLFAYIGAILMVGQGVLVRRMLPRMGEYRMALLGVALMTVGFLLISSIGQKQLADSALWYTLPIITIGFSAVTPSLQSMLSQSASGDQQGAILGTGQSLSALARIAGPYLGIQLLDVSIATPYLLAAGLMVLGGIAIARTKFKPATAESAS